MEEAPPLTKQSAKNITVDSSPSHPPAPDIDNQNATTTTTESKPASSAWEESPTTNVKRTTKRDAKRKLLVNKINTSGSMEVAPITTSSEEILSPTAAKAQQFLNGFGIQLTNESSIDELIPNLNSLASSQDEFVQNRFTRLCGFEEKGTTATEDSKEILIDESSGVSFPFDTSSLKKSAANSRRGSVVGPTSRRNSGDYTSTMDFKDLLNAMPTGSAGETVRRKKRLSGIFNFNQAPPPESQSAYNVVADASSNGLSLNNRTETHCTAVGTSADSRIDSKSRFFEKKKNKYTEGALSIESGMSPIDSTGDVITRNTSYSSRAISNAGSTNDFVKKRDTEISDMLHKLLEDERKMEGSQVSDTNSENTNKDSLNASDSTATSAATSSRRASNRRMSIKGKIVKVFSRRPSVVS